MNDKELLDHFATHAMTAQIEKFGVTNPYTLAQTAYRVALDMLDNRRRIHNEWKAEEARKEEEQNADILDLNLPIRYYRCLIAEGIHTKKKLCEFTEREVRRFPNFGEKGRKLLREAMAEHGLKLKGQP